MLCGFLLLFFQLRARVIEKSKLEGASRGRPVQALLKAMPVLNNPKEENFTK